MPLRVCFAWHHGPCHRPLSGYSCALCALRVADTALLCRAECEGTPSAPAVACQPAAVATPGAGVLLRTVQQVHPKTPARQVVLEEEAEVSEGWLGVTAEGTEGGEMQAGQSCLVAAAVALTAWLVLMHRLRDLASTTSPGLRDGGGGC